MAYFDAPLFDEAPEAWVHGPVYPSVYAAYKKFKYNTISLKIKDVPGYAAELESQNNLSNDEKELVRKILNVYGTKQAIELEYLTHIEEPWLEQRKGLDDTEPSHNQISLKTMRSYFLSKRKKK